MKTLFLQFANLMTINEKKFLGLGNGFSDTLDFCKSKGEMFWFLQKYTHRAEEHHTALAMQQCEESEFPIKEGIVFASAINIMNLYQLYIWAKKFPNIQFIVGGPAVISKLFVLIEKLPNNIIFTEKTVEEYFGLKDFSYPWKLEPPNFYADGIAFAYTINTSCYWGQCIFCGPHAFCKKRERKEINFEFEKIQYDKQLHIRLNTPSISPKEIQYLTKLPKKDNITYNILTRAGNQETKEFRKLFLNKQNNPNFFLGIGLEFPSNRMLSYMNKGLSKEEIIENIYLLSEIDGITLAFTMILGWNSLIDNDIVELQDFFNKLGKIIKDKKIILYRLRNVHSREIHNTKDERLKELNIGPFYLGYFQKLNQKQEQLNIEAKKIIETSCGKVVNYYD